ncbi:MAG: hypothetical protein Q9179_001022 [Wetmoreana sp. 5 TL-2023]
MSDMEGDEHQRRQYEHQQYSRGFGSSFRPNVPEGNASERLRQAQMMTGRSPASTSVVSATGAHPQELGSFGYPQGPQYPPGQVQGSSLQFPVDYDQDAQRAQNFPSYASQMVYNVPQQPPPRSPYDAVPQYPPRQSAAIEVLTNQFGVPTQYYHQNEPMGASGQASPHQQYASSQYQQAISYQTAGIGRNTMSSSYPTGIPEFPQASAPEAVEQQEQPSTSHDEEYNQYQQALKQTFENASKGRLVEAGQSLLEISEWLLGHAKELGLVSDDQSLREERLKLWSEFNLCWLAVLQRQKDDTQLMLDTGQAPPPPRNILREEFLERMAESLVHLCDGMEKYGLVDYQMGVWEEEIMSILTQCLDLLEGKESNRPEASNVDPQIQEGPSHQ